MRPTALCCMWRAAPRLLSGPGSPPPTSLEAQEGQRVLFGVWGKWQCDRRALGFEVAGQLGTALVAAR